MRAIRRVVEQGAFSNLVIPAELTRAGLTGRDRAFAADLAFGTIRRLIPIDWAIGSRSSRPVKDVDPDGICAAIEAVVIGSEMPVEEGQLLEATLFGLLCATEDTKEGMRAFLEKRAANFTGK